MKKSIYATALVATAALTLAACGSAPEDDNGDGNGDDTDQANGEGAEEVEFQACLVSDQGGWDDQSFNQSAKEGLEDAVADLGVQESDAESQDPSDFAPNVDALVQENCELIIGVGFLLEEALHSAADENPDINFGLVDAVFEEEIDNGKPLVFNTAEASYLAGYLAAGMTESGTVATFGGMQIPSVAIFMDGFADGVDKYNEDNDDDVTLLGWDKEDQDGAFSGDFENQAQGQALTEQFISQGADIIMPVAGPVGLGAAAAAQEADDVSIIGVDSDWVESTEYGDIVLTSVVKEIGAAVFDTIDEASQDNFTAEAYIGTLENGGVSLADYASLDVPDDLAAEVDALEEGIISGEITVETTNAP